ncbi:MAG TPA: FAD-binding protein [Caulobacteraceae bacterium]|nr:FAD-binding protein [Caulobacteraceae bacterium]
MNRRDLISAGASLAAAVALGARPARAAALSRVRPDAPGWPSPTDWAELGRATGGRLAPVSPPDLSGPGAKALLSNPFYIGDQPGLTESSGWLDAWRSAPSAYAVAAESAADVAAAVRFARAHNVRLVVKGRGHSYFGASNAPDSLLVWTRHMDGVTVHDAFTPQGSNSPPVPAVSVGGGAMWLHAYQAVTTGAGRYVQGGGCTTVGVAGLVQGGGFGSFSKGFGMAAASLLEAEIVLASGEALVVNHAQSPDLFWALKGGGGGTFGVVTRLTLATHDLPDMFGAARLTLHAKSDEAFRRLLARFVAFYAENLFNPHWGEQVSAQRDNKLEISMVFQGLSQDDARAAWKPLLDFVAANPSDYDGQGSFLVLALPARHFWDPDFLKRLPGVITSDPRPGAPSTDFWWSGNTDEAGTFWEAYTSAWLPAELLKPANQARLVGAWFAASRHWGVSFHLNKGLAGAPDAAIASARDTATNPQATRAFALAIIACDGATLYGGRTPDLAGGRARAGRVQAAMQALRACAPDAGAYVNECDYHQPDWQRAFWGENYPRLLAIKRKYDPDGLFTVHHGVGSEGWRDDGLVRRG